MDVIDTIAAEPSQPDLPALGAPGSVTRYSGLYAPDRGNGNTYVYEASWQRVCGCLVWNCTMWESDLSSAFMGGSMRWPLNDEVGHVRARIEREIDEAIR